MHIEGGDLEFIFILKNLLLSFLKKTVGSRINILSQKLDNDIMYQLEANINLRVLHPMTSSHICDISQFPI